MTKLYKKSELAFAIMWIVIYCVLQSFANPINDYIGIQNLANAVFNVALVVILFAWISKNGLLEKYKFRKSDVPARRFLFYIPLLILISHNLWNGIGINFPLAEGILYVLYMACVGFVEEVLFRGLLFEAIARDNPKSAIVITSITFGAGHILHLINGSGAELIPNICQVVGAIAIGFMFALIYYRGGSIIPCIITHSAIDMVSVFGNEAGFHTADGALDVSKRVLFSLSRLIIVVIYTLILNKTLPKENSSKIRVDKSK